MLLKTRGVGSVTFRRAMDIFDSPKELCEASYTQLSKAGIFSPSVIDGLLAMNAQQVQVDLAWLDQSEHHHIITLHDERYPKSLLQMYDPPIVLYVNGNPALLSEQQLAIVGSRNPTTTGAKNAHHFASVLSQHLTITSGLAMGIDAQAHLGALTGGGHTIAICGMGLDSIYPAKNKHLAHEIIQRGALVSEFAIGTEPNARNFPKRNRIITGLSNGVLVVEGAIKSGSMVSARLATEQNKEVFAIPGSIHNPLASGCHALIKEGAYLVDSPEDIRQILHIESTNAHTKTPVNTSDNLKDAPQEANVLLKYIDYDGLSIDELVVLSGLTISEVNNLIMTLELNGNIEKTIHNTYIKI